MTIVENLKEKLLSLDGINNFEYIINKDTIIYTDNSEFVTIQTKVNKKDLINKIDFQQEKGLKKYGHTIDDCPKDKYNWNDMSLEEIVDFLIYKEKENLC